MAQRYLFDLAFRVEPYGRHVYVFRDRDRWAKFCKRRKELREHADVSDCDGVTIYASNCKVYVGLFNNLASIAAHEASHAAVGILEHAGVVLEGRNDEPLAYLVGHLVGKFMKEE